MLFARGFGYRRTDIGKWLLAAGFTAFIWLASCSVAQAQVPGFAEPFRTVEVASAESGVVTNVLVKAGDRLEAGQTVAQLDSSIQQAQLELARHMAAAKAELRRFEAELQSKQSVYEHLRRLSEEGFAQEKELIRAQMDLEVAKANALSSQEHLQENKCRLQLAEIGLDRREIRTPVSGFVAEVHREPGEFISPVNPQVVTVVQIDPMIGKFQVNVAEIDRLRVDQTVTIKTDHGPAVSGKIHSIAMKVDSETVAVKVSMPNQDRTFLSGQRCYMQLPPRAELTRN